MKLKGQNRSTRGKTCPSATLSTIHSARTDPGSNPGLRGERPATNCLSHGTAKVHLLGYTDQKQENSHSGDLVAGPSFKLKPLAHETERPTIRTSQSATVAVLV